MPNFSHRQTTLSPFLFVLLMHFMFFIYFRLTLFVQSSPTLVWQHLHNIQLKALVVGLFLSLHRNCSHANFVRRNWPWKTTWMLTHGESNNCTTIIKQNIQQTMFLTPFIHTLGIPVISRFSSIEKKNCQIWQKT